jgi:hypothetical protein
LGMALNPVVFDIIARRLAGKPVPRRAHAS